jgi:phage terminase small subunit
MPPVTVPLTDDARAFLLSVMNDQSADPRLRLDAAKTLYRGAADTGKKELKADAAKQAGSGKYAPRPAPLKLVG